MLSLSHSRPHPTSPFLPSPSPPHTTIPPPSRRLRRPTATISAIIIGGGRGRGDGGGGDSKLPFTPPPILPPGKVYQPFHPPPSPIPGKFRHLDAAQSLAVLREREGLWYEYAPLIAALSRDGFTPPSIEEATGISGVEQNCLVVASQIRSSLAASPTDFPQELLFFFDSFGGPELLYGLRFLNARQRADAAKHIISNRLDPKGSFELARSMKDFPRRRGEYGWEDFTAPSPGDCLAYARFRQSREVFADSDRLAELRRAQEVVDTEAARERIEREIERVRKKAAGEKVEDDETEKRPAVLVVRLMYGEVAQATTVVLIPVVREAEGAKALEAAPRRRKTDIDFGIVETDKGWTRWAVVPGWGPVAEAADEAVAVELKDGRMLPWRTAMEQEKVMVVADRRRKAVEEEGLYLVEKKAKLVVEKGSKLVEEGVSEAAAEVVVVVRPPKDVDDMISDEEWD